MNLLTLENLAFSKQKFIVEESHIEIAPNRFLSNSPVIYSALAAINDDIQRGDKKFYLHNCEKYSQIIRKERAFQPLFTSVAISGNYEAIFDSLVSEEVEEIKELVKKVFTGEPKVVSEELPVVEVKKDPSLIEVAIPYAPLKEIEVTINVDSPEPKVEVAPVVEEAKPEAKKPAPVKKPVAKKAAE